jgi:cytochrome c
MKAYLVLAALAFAGTAMAAGDPAAGAKVFERTCTSCHSFDQGALGKQGPHLRGIMGRKVASVRGFIYSDALKNLDFSWTAQTMHDYLANPIDYAPGSKKIMPVKDAQQLENVLAYLAEMQSGTR